ncbi:MAG: protein kinase [Firmicutes bacterium]|nr:protein kinase [Bacillota bacterium]
MCAEFKDLADLIGEEKLRQKMAELGEEKPSGKALQEGSIVNERYKVLKILNDKGSRACYLVKDIKVTDKKFLLREFTPEPMDKHKLRERREKFREIIRILSSFKHKNLTEVYDGFSENNREYCIMEYIEGLDLSKLMEMSTTGFPEKKVVDWGLALADSIEFMHYRPKPFTLGEMGPQQIMVDSGGTLKIISYDLQRFFDPKRTLEFMPDDPETLYDDITKFAQTLYFLLTKEEYDEHAYELNFPKGTSPKLVKLLETTCNPGQKSIGSIKVFRQKLQDSLVPEEDLTKKGAEKVWDDWFNLWKKLKLRTIDAGARFWDGFTAQHPLTIGFEVIFILFLIFWSVSHSLKPPPKDNPPGSIFVTSDKYLMSVFSPAKNNEFDIFQQNEISFTPSNVFHAHIKLAGETGLYLAGKPVIIKSDKPVNKDVLLICDALNPYIHVFDVKNNELIGSLKTDVDPGAIFTDPEEKNIYVLHNASATISVLNPKNLKLDNRITTGSCPMSPIYLAAGEYDEKGIKTERLKTETAAKPAVPAKKMPPSPTVIISNPPSKKIEFINPETGKVKDILRLDGQPGKMVLSPEKDRIYVLDIKNNKLLNIELKTWDISQYDLPCNETPADIVMDPANKKLWITQPVNGMVSPFDITTEKFGKPVNHKGQPMKLAVNNGQLWLLNKGTKDLNVLDTNGAIISRISLDRVPNGICFIK